MIGANTHIENLNLYIKKAAAGGTFEASVRDDRGNVQARNTFRYYVDSFVLSKLEDSVGKNAKETATLIRSFGQELFNAVFGGEILGYFKSLEKGRKDIRLKLVFRQDEPELQHIPWEFLYDGANFLSAYPRIIMSRALEGIPAAKREPIEGKLSVLAVISSPLDLKDHQRLQIEQEQMLILQALDRASAANRIDIDFLDEASLKNIQAKLDEEDYHIFHYTGHGHYSDSESKGYLLLEDDSGASCEVDNETVAGLLAGNKSLRLVVLSGCQTAKTSGRKALGDLATPLLLRNIPAVVAMQYSVSDLSAIALAQKLYSQIADGVPVDLALTRARKELLLNKSAGAAEFATPVLYCDDPDCLTTRQAPPATEGASLRLRRPVTFRLDVHLSIEQLGNEFIGRRRELRRVKEDFFQRGMRAVVLHGIGGIGKTVTAAKIAEKLRDDFDGIYAFDCREGFTAEEILLQLNDFLKRNDNNALDEICTAPVPTDTKINYLAQVLSQVRLLLIFDNFESLLSEAGGAHEIADAELKKSLRALISQCADGSRFLFTGRYTFDLTGGRLTNVIDEINLGELARPEAVMVMNRFPQIAAQPFAAKLEIHDKIGGHPYTINIFGRHANRTSVRDVLADIAGVNREMVEFTLLDKSYLTLGKAARHLIDSAAVLKRAIPPSALACLVKENGGRPNMDKAIDELTGWGLIIKTEEQKEAMFQVHTLVKEYVRSQTAEGEWKRRLVRAARCYEKLVETTGSPWDYLDARALYFDAGEYDEAGKIVGGVMEVLYRWGFLDLLRKLNEETIETASGSVRAAALHHLGMIHQAQGEYDKAIEKYTQSLKIHEELGNRAGIATTLHQLGNIHEDRGEYDKAVEKYTQSLKIEEELGNRAGIATSLHQLGMIHEDQGEYDKAAEKYTQSLKIKEELGDRAGVAATLHQLGMIHQRQGEHDKALEKYTQSLKINEEIGNRGDIAASLHQLGMIHQREGEYDKAVERYTQSLKINEELGNRGGIASTLHQLGIIYQRQGEYDKAAEKYAQSLKIEEELGNRAGIAASLGQLGKIHQARKEYKKALGNYVKAALISEKLKSPDLEIAKRAIGSLRKEVGEKVFKKYLGEIEKELKGEGHE